MSYHRDGTLASRTSQAHSGETATTIAFDYDDLRRMTKQRVTTVGTGVDDWVEAIKTTFDPNTGGVYKVTCYDDPNSETTVVNEIRYAYSDLGQVERVAGASRLTARAVARTRLPAVGS